MNRRLYRCRHDRRISGVASGVAQFFDLDPTIVRVLWVLSIFLGGFGLLLYVAMAIIVPLEPEEGVEGGAEYGPQAGVEGADPAATAPVGPPHNWHTAPSTHTHRARGGGHAMTIIGAILVLFGALALVDTVLPGWADHGRFLWPAFIVGVGALLVATSLRRGPADS